MDHNLFTRGYAIALHHEGYSCREISDKIEKKLDVRVGKSSINEWVNKYQNE